MKFTFDLPDPLIEQHNEGKIRLEIALALFQAEIFTLGQGSGFAQMTQRAFQRELGKRRIPVHYDEEMLENDLATLNELFGDRHE